METKYYTAESAKELAWDILNEMFDQAHIVPSDSTRQNMDTKMEAIIKQSTPSLVIPQDEVDMDEVIDKNTVTKEVCENGTESLNGTHVRFAIADILEKYATLLLGQRLAKPGEVVYRHNRCGVCNGIGGFGGGGGECDTCEGHGYISEEVRLPADQVKWPSDEAISILLQDAIGVATHANQHTVNVDKKEATKYFLLYLKSYQSQQTNSESAYDDISRLHDWICEKLEKISQTDLDTNEFLQGRYRALKSVVNEIEENYTKSQQTNREEK